MRISDWSSDVCASRVRRLSQAMRFHLRPLGVSQHKSFHPKLESQTSSTWNPKSQQALEQIRVGWNRRRRSTDPVNRLYPFEVDQIGRAYCRARVWKNV